MCVPPRWCSPPLLNEGIKLKSKVTFGVQMGVRSKLGLRLGSAIRVKVRKRVGVRMEMVWTKARFFQYIPI